MVTTTGARIGVTVATDVLCGVSAGAGTRMINNAIDGRPISENVLTTAVVGGVSGAISASAGAGIGQGIRQISAPVGKVFAHTAGGAVCSGSSGAVGMLIQNVTNYGKIKKNDFILAMKQNNITEDVAE